jgi:methyltransferase
VPDSISFFDLVNWSPLHLLIPLVIVQRLVELRIARRNERKLRARGAVEAGRDHYPAIVALHLLWFVGMIGEILIQSRQINPFWLPLLLIFLAAQWLRWLTIRTLGERWNTRILILPGARAITGGPYRYVRHPNYIVVAVELLILPLIFSAYLTAATATLLNAVLLRIRIRAEERALREIGREYEKVGGSGVGNRGSGMGERKKRKI